MKFGTRYSDVKDEVVETSGGGDFLRTFKDGTTDILILQEPEEWIAYWEHSQYSVGGFPFPCDETDDCPGCNHSNENVQKRSRKFVIQAITFAETKKGEPVEYINAYKVPRTIADKLDLRYQRRETLRDRIYSITRFKTGERPWDVEYDIEAGDPIKKDLSECELLDVDAILTEAYNNRDERGKTSSRAQTAKEEPKRESRRFASRQKEDSSPKVEDAPEGSQRARTGNPDDAPFDGNSEGSEPEEYVETEYAWEDLEEMPLAKLIEVIEYEQRFDKMPQADIREMSKSELLDWIADNA